MLGLHCLDAITNSWKYYRELIATSREIYANQKEQATRRAVSQLR